MLLTIHGVDGVTADVQATVVTTATVSGEYGTLAFTLPRSSDLRPSLDVNGGFLIEAHLNGRTFRFIAGKPTWTPANVRIEAHSIASWATARLIGANRVYQGVTAGVIFRRAVMDAFEGVAHIPVRIGAVLDAPPILNVPIAFNRQPLASLLAELERLTGHYWEMSEDGEISWKPKAGRYREGWLIDDGRMFPALQDGTLADTFAEVIEIDEYGRLFSSITGDAPRLWPAQRIERT